MNVKDAIDLRFSVRRYKDKDVPDELLLQLVDAARLAPSGCNRQAWKFKVLKREEVKKLEKDIFPQPWVIQGPSMIVCCYDMGVSNDKEDDPVKGTEKEFKLARDLGIASAFIVLRAVELGLGSCYIGWMDKEKMEKHLGLNDDIKVLFVISVGYADEDARPKVRKKIEEVMI